MKSTLIASLLLFMFSGQLLAEQKVLNFAFFPYTIPSEILEQNKELKDYLQKELNRPISLMTAKSPEEYLHNIKEGSYDIIFSAPHVARFSERKHSYQRIAMTKTKIQGYYLVKKSSDLKSLADATHKSISMAEPSTIVHQIAVQDLKALGLEEGKNINIKITKNHINSIYALIKGSSDVAVTGVKLWQELDPKYKNELRVLEESSKVPGFIVMGNDKMSKELREKIKIALLKYQESKEGEKYIFKGFKLIDDESMKSLDKYTEILN